MSQSNPMGWIELNVQDIQRAKTFYESVLQIALSEVVIPDTNSKCGAFPGHGGHRQFRGFDSGGWRSFRTRWHHDLLPV
jgi:predicted enzyme related to lactoylglutathione lyase